MRNTDSVNILQISCLIQDDGINTCLELALSASALSSARRREEDTELRVEGGGWPGWRCTVDLDTAEHTGVVVGGCITYSTLLHVAILILILHTLIPPATNLETFICVHFNGMPGSSALTVAWYYTDSSVWDLNVICYAWWVIWSTRLAEGYSTRSKGPVDLCTVYSLWPQIFG